MNFLSVERTNSYLIHPLLNKLIFFLEKSYNVLNITAKYNSKI